MGATVRCQDWPERLNQLLIDCHKLPFVWGEHDCCLFAANVILEITGADPAESLRGSYSSVTKASKILKARGGVRGIATSALGEEISPLQAQRGDIVLVQTEDHGDTLAVCVGENCVAPGLTRLESIPMSSAVTAWQVL